jgi:hypothetical protein
MDQKRKEQIDANDVKRQEKDAKIADAKKREETMLAEQKRKFEEKERIAE